VVVPVEEEEQLVEATVVLEPGEEWAGSMMLEAQNVEVVDEPAIALDC